MSDVITLSASKRDILGKQVRGLRSQGQTPAVVHDHGNDSLHITVDEAELKKVYSSAGKHHTVKLKIDGKDYTAMIKDVVVKPATNKIYHTVFQSVNEKETIKAEVPLQLVGEMPAEKVSLLVLLGIDRVEIEARAKDLVDSLEVDATVLADVGDKITVADIKVPEGIEIKTDPEQVIASVEMPKDQIAEADAAAAELAEDAGTTAEEATEEPADEAAAESPEEAPKEG